MAGKDKQSCEESFDQIRSGNRPASLGIEREELESIEAIP
jgi:hypothetical protein